MEKCIAILTGGTSSERDVALLSAELIKNTLEGRFKTCYYDLPEDLDKFLSERGSIDAVIPIFHGRGGEDGCIQGFLRTLNISFLFSDVEAQAIAADKSLSKIVVAKLGIKTPNASVVSKGERAIYKNIVVIKPLDGGSSIGISIAKDQNYFEKALVEAFKRSSKVLIEDHINGDEYTVAVIETKDGAMALPVIAIKSKNEYFDTESKYDPSLVDEVCPAPISDDLAFKLKDGAVKVHKAIGARHLSRSDFIVDNEGLIWFLEINTIPGMTENSLLPKTLKVAGIDFGDLIESWITKLK